MQSRLRTAITLTLATSCHLLAAGIALAAQPAKTYPERPIRFVVGQTAGSSIDTMSRIIATRMGDVLGQQLVVDNRTGAGGLIAGEIVASAAPDGYTVFAAATASQIIGPQLYKKVLKYNPQTDFTPIGMFAITQNVLVVNPKTPFKTMKDIIAYAKANPGKINWGNAGTGFQSHLASVLLTHMAGINVLHVPYKGAGPLVAGLIAGESQITIGPAPAWMVHVQSGRARAIAMGGEKRSILWPELPTIIESGVPGYVSDGWAGLMGPKGLPAPIREKLHAVLNKVVSEPVTNEALKKVGAEPLSSTAEEFRQRIAKDWKSMGEAIRVSGLRIE
jgi:tripartite-type tricarboxylate transporter receptor subunit TctC